MITETLEAELAEGNESIADYRAKAQAIEKPWANGYAYFGLANVTAAGGIAAALSFLNDVQPLEWLAVPITFLAANIFEWVAHRGPMHNRRDLLEILFTRHTLVHHRYFPHTAMSVKSHQEWGYVLFPIWAIFLVVLGMIPLALIVNYNHGANVAALFYSVGVGYYLLYEWLHLVYHLPPDSRVGRLRVVRALASHHTHHHNLRLMQKYNFNVTFPIADYLFGTAYRENEAAKKN